jgi:hypothetical protein
MVKAEAVRGENETARQGSANDKKAMGLLRIE